MKRDKGFTLVEILIVVIILGILAAIVIPQFTEASNDARESALASDLQTMRSQLELYKVQHLENYPGTDPVTGGFSATLFLSQLTSRTNAQGETGTDAATYPFGPYLQKFPSNPFASANVDNIEGAATQTADGDPGWFFDTDTGAVAPNDADHADM
ncbi:MAG: prepilin-type N-terminal cleavage/methylation domain-containing protein [Planctomycetota bacterium]|jgi:general secretion pathway protein G